MPIGFAPCHSLLAAPILCSRWERGLSLCPKEFTLRVFMIKPFAEALGWLGQGWQQVRNTKVTANVCHPADARDDKNAHNRVCSKKIG